MGFRGSAPFLPLGLEKLRLCRFVWVSGAGSLWLRLGHAGASGLGFEMWLHVSHVGFELCNQHSRPLLGPFWAPFGPSGVQGHILLIGIFRLGHILRRWSGAGQRQWALENH